MICLSIQVNAHQEPAIVDEIIPEVKQIFQTAYFNCTVVNKTQDSRVSTVVTGLYLEVGLDLIFYFIFNTLTQLIPYQTTVC